jgi:hypothetical protein
LRQQHALVGVDKRAGDEQSEFDIAHAAFISRKRLEILPPRPAIFQLHGYCTAEETRGYS